MDAPQKNLMGRCENNDGKPARFEGFGHKFCWGCYSAFLTSFKASAETIESQMRDENQLPLIYDYIA